MSLTDLEMAANGSTTILSSRSPTELVSQLIARELQDMEVVFSAELASKQPYVRELVAHLKHYRGKRLRPMLLFLVAKACGKISPEHVTLAAVVEMIHTATLVHDDVLDHASIRRHVATVNAQWGNASSVLLGDLLFTHAFYLASTTGSTVACRLIGEATNLVCAGELQQVGEAGNLNLSEENYYSIIEGKTAALTACAAQLGAIFADASEALVEGMTRFGRELGLAFQIADDVLDLISTEDEAGKSLGTDLAQQKMTLPLIALLQQSDAAQKDQLKQLIANPTPAHCQTILRLLEKSGAIRHALTAAEKHVANARRELSALPISETRALLEALAASVVHRRK